MDALEALSQASGHTVRDAALILRELAKLGFAVVPREASEAMWQAGRSADAHPGDSYSAVWRAMAEAAEPTIPRNAA